MARGVDLGFLAGSGHGSNQPLGLSNISGQPTVMCGGTSATNGASPTIDDFSALVDQLDEGNAPQENRAWFMSVRTRRRLRDLKDSLGRPLYSQNLQEKDPVELYGYPIFTSTQISNTQTVGSSNTASSVILGAMSDVYVGQGIKSKGLEIAISDQALFANNQIAIRLLYRTDIQPGHVASVALLTGVL
jgi:HK97 family phage major capsid protein